MKRDMKLDSAFEIIIIMVIIVDTNTYKRRLQADKRLLLQWET